VVFEDEERPLLLPYDGIPYDVPFWRDVTVHPDHHVSVQYALYVERRLDLSATRTRLAA